MMIPGFLISLITFPGVIVHEFAHQMFCRLFRIPVYEVVYFQAKDPVGYVSHEPTESVAANLFISVGPFLINTVLGVLLSLPAAITFIEFNTFNILHVILYYFGLSILMHAFPSTGDASALYQSIIKNKKVNLFVKILVFPVIGLIYLGAIGSVVWLDYIYGVGVVLLVPRLLVMLFT